MKLYQRSGLAAVVAVTAASIAAGCGGSDSGAAGAAKNAAVLDLVPANAIGYVVVDTDFSGAGWGHLNSFAKIVDPKFTTVEEQLAKSASEDKVDFAKDVDPWLGDSAGAAVLSMEKDAKSADFFVWVDLDDAAAFKKFALSQGDDMKAGADIGDFKTLESTKGSAYEVVAYNDDYALFTDTRADLTKIIEFDGDSITKADGVSDAIDGVGDDALATLVIGGEGTREIVKSTDELKAFAENAELKSFQSMALSFGASDDGLMVAGFVGTDGKDTPKNIDNKLFSELPASTLLAIGGDDLGGGLKMILDEAGKDNKQVQQGVGAISAVVGLDLADLAKAFSGEYVVGVSADDAGLGALFAGIGGAAMGGGTSGLDPAALTKSATMMLMFRETGDASETIDKLAGALGGLTGATAAPKPGKMGDFTTKSMTLGGLPVTTAATDDVAGLVIGADVLTTWGKTSLGESDAFADAWKAAGAPDKTLGSMWLDAGRIATLAGLEPSDEGSLGGMVGWLEGDGSNAKFGMFLHVAKK